MTREETKQLAQQLAQDLNDFYYDYDTYGYKDAVDDPEEEIKALKEYILKNEFGDILSDIQSIIDEDEPEDDVEIAKSLIKRLEEYKEITEVEEV